MTIMITKKEAVMIKKGILIQLLEWLKGYKSILNKMHVVTYEVSANRIELADDINKCAAEVKASSESTKKRLAALKTPVTEKTRRHIVG